MALAWVRNTIVLINKSQAHCLYISLFRSLAFVLCGIHWRFSYSVLENLLSWKLFCRTTSSTTSKLYSKVSNLTFFFRFILDCFYASSHEGVKRLNKTKIRILSSQFTVLNIQECEIKYCEPSTMTNYLSESDSADNCLWFRFQEDCTFPKNLLTINSCTAILAVVSTDWYD